MAELATLRTAKIAVNEGLITQEDFDTVKLAFIKASQIKAGLDAGFIREEDYEHARHSFLHSLDFAVVKHPASSDANLAPANVPLPRPSSLTAVGNIPSAGVAAARAAAHQRSSSSAGTSVQLPSSHVTSGPLSVAPTAAGPSSNGQLPFPSQLPLLQQHNSGGCGTVEVPADLSRFQRGPSAVGKKSMAGIGLSEQAIAIFNFIKTKAAHKWVTFRIDDAGHEVIIDTLGAQNATFEDFVAALPLNQSRYGVFDYAYTNADTGSTVNKLVFIHWAPDNSSTRSKMMYASTKDFFKGFLDGVGAELQATEVSELNDAEMRDRVHQAITRK